MLALISPAKKLDAETAPPLGDFTLPQQLDNSDELVGTVRGLGKARLKALMKLSDALTELNHDRFERYGTPFSPDNAKQAVFMFRGDTYVGLDADTLSKDDLTYAQKHLGILSGLYGVLRPLDLIQPYRLEMGSKLATGRGKDLYEFWGSQLTDTCNEVTASHDDRTVVSLASKEYIGAIQPQNLAGAFVTCHFKEMREGVLKTIGLVAKKARGRMARFMVQNRVERVDDLKGFGEDGYGFEPELSSDGDLVFVRDRR
ncbi:MAG TPA: peroxide stress protein YaaA [Gemmatimonadetes bacterium]|nr:peroxide stress protein YaaA [Gemmatimonadota bacterium]